jgi:hypothetical protein
MREEIFIDPTLCCITYALSNSTRDRTVGRVKTIEYTSLKLYLISNRVWWCLIPTKRINE